MLKFFKLLAVTNLLAVAVAFTPCQAQKTNLTLNLEKGKEYKQVTSSKTTIVQEMNGQKMNVEMILKGKISYKVVSVNSSDYDLNVKYESLSMTMDLPQGKVEFSSEKNDDQDVFSTLLSNMLGNTFNVKMAKNGKILEVKNVESLFENFDEITNNQSANLKEQITKFYGADAFKGNIEIITGIFPDKPVKKGDKWTIKTKVGSGLEASFIATTEYELADLNSDYVMIKGNAAIETEDTYNESSELPMKYDLKGSMISEIKVDKVTGWIIEAKINQKMNGNGFIKGNPQMPDGMKIPMTISQEMLITN